ncbi:hypothetical protein pipiens_004137 [Culex pipiens pipiens]|uniref:ZAD domain-containing protein n=1 Tax=Culex pipiens pipiens TaxID=38569 RepID=A0ABD1CMM3_CULPP
MKVIEDTVRRLGGASQFHEVNSAEFDDVDDYVLKLYKYNASTMYDFGANAITRSNVMNEHFYYSIVPVTMHVAAPTGRPLTAFEVFIAPFRIELWTSLLMLMLVCTLVMLLFPTRFINDLILLPMCSFQRRALHRVSLLEKIVFIALIAIFFVLFKAYEAKITAFMTNFPHSRDPRTLDDLLQSNITIEQDEGDFGEDMSDEDPRYRQLFSPVPFRGKYTIHWKSQNLAFVGSRLFMKLAMSDARNFEPETGRPRFTVVDRFTLGERIAFYFCTFRNPLVAKVQRAEMWHFEAGLVDFWVQELIQQQKGSRHSGIARGGVVGLFELKPVFYGISIGWIMAGLVELWVSLIAMIAICIAMMRLFPKQFHNDLILLPICGIERRQFHQVSPLEKATLVTLIIVYYILFNAYEAKIIAFMTNFPYAPDPHTFHDLLQSNVTTQNFDAGFETMMITEDPRLRQLFGKPMPRTNISVNWNCRDRAYIGSRPYLQFIMSDAENYDPETGRRRLVILDQFTLGNRVGFVFIGYRNPLAKAVQRLEMQYFEAGLMDHWLRRHIREAFGVRHVDFVAKGFATTRNTIGIIELEPAWCALAGGWIIAGMVLVLELGRRRMVVLDQFTFGIRVGFFFTSYRHPLVPKLQRAEFQFFEGGFTQFWLKQITQRVQGANIVDIVAKGYNIVHENIDFIALKPACCSPPQTTMANRSESAPPRPVCRVCLSSDVLQVAIYGAYGRAHKIPVKIRVCLPITVDRNDNHSKTICHRCVTKLDEYYDYYCNSLTSDRIWKGEELSFQKYLRRKVDSKLTAAVERRTERETRVVPAPVVDDLLLQSPKLQLPNSTYVVERREDSPRPEPSASFLDMKNHSQRKRKPKVASQSKKIQSTYTVSQTLFD